MGGFGATSWWIHHVVLCYGIHRCILYYLCFGNSLDLLISYYEVTYEFSEVADLNPDLPEEIIYGPSPNYHYCF